MIGCSVIFTLGAATIIYTVQMDLARPDLLQSPEMAGPGISTKNTEEIPLNTHPLIKAKSGNLNLFLRILPFFPFKLQGKQGKKEQNAQKKV